VERELREREHLARLPGGVVHGPGDEGVGARRHDADVALGVLVIDEQPLEGEDIIFVLLHAEAAGGDLEHIRFAVPLDVWQEVSAESDECVGGNVADRHVIVAERAAEARDGDDRRVVLERLVGRERHGDRRGAGGVRAVELDVLCEVGRVLYEGRVLYGVCGEGWSSDWRFGFWFQGVKSMQGLGGPSGVGGGLREGEGCGWWDAGFAVTFRGRW